MIIKRIHGVRKVYQTNTGRDGDCLQACMQAIFPVMLGRTIPEFRGKEWVKEYSDYLASADYGVILVPIDSSKGGLGLFERLNPTLNATCIVSVMSKKHYRMGHAVIGEITNGKLAIIHDPNPENSVNDHYEVWTIHLFHYFEEK